MSELLSSLKRADRIGIDVEGNGLHAYRAELCVVQVAWRTPEGEIGIGIVDPFAVDVEPLACVLEQSGPLKVLHDLTFDARLLGDYGIQLGNVHDTSVMAQFLGEPKSGLASLVKIYFGDDLSKALQDHDWAARPFTEPQLGYLSQDVRFLLDLDDKLTQAVAKAGIESEVATECAYKLKTAGDPPRDQRSPHERVKGYKTLSPRARTILKRLTDARERIAEIEDHPPFRIAPNGLLLEIARRMPTDERTLQRLCRRKPAGRHADAWLEAVRIGKTDEMLPDAPRPPSPEPMAAAEQVLRKRLKKKLNEWRKREAARREVTLQVVIPGHCMTEVADAIATHRGDVDATLEALSEIHGLGDARVDRYLGTWVAIVAP